MNRERLFPPHPSGARLIRLLVLAAVLSFPGWVRAETATVAVASNFLATARVLEAGFEAATEHEITLAHGSTGRLYAQIVQGAPFDVFLSADAERPAQLEADGLSAARIPYAIGRLVLVTRGAVDPLDLRGKRIALANPEIAPYGRAAIEAMADLGLSEEEATLLFGDSVGQAAGIFVSGSADAAFLAGSQVAALDEKTVVTPMAGRHQPIRQEAVLLSRGAGNVAAAEFFTYLTGGDARLLIGEAGYERPGE